MTNLLKLRNLSELVYQAEVAIPKEFSRHLTTKKKGAKASALQRMYENELNTKLYLYERIMNLGEDELPDDVIEEILQNRSECLVLLLHYQLKNSYIKGANYTARQLFDEDLTVLNEEILPFLTEQITQLIINSEDKRTLDEIASSDFTNNNELLKKLIKESLISLDYSNDKPQATIATLIDYAKTKDVAGIVANFYLAQIYGSLKLPFEELNRLSQWMVCISEVFNSKIAEVAAKIPQMEKAILDGVIKRINLLNAQQQSLEANRIIDEFKAFGFTEEMSLLKINHSREEGYQCKIITKDIVSREMDARSVIYDLLLNSPRKNACIIVRDEQISDPDKFPVSAEIEIEKEIIKELANGFGDLGFEVISEPIEENMLETRKWVVCYDRAEPTSASAIGILPTRNHYSIVYSRAIIFDTQVNMDKDESWFKKSVQLLSGSFDPQKQDGIRDAIKKISLKLAPSRSDIKIHKV